MFSDTVHMKASSVFEFKCSISFQERSKFFDVVSNLIVPAGDTRSGKPK